MNSQFANIATPSEIVISTTFSLEFGGTVADMHICFPYSMICLLYTSDAADERSSVDLGGRRIIKKKNEETRKEKR